MNYLRAYTQNVLGGRHFLTSNEEKNGIKHFFKSPDIILQKYKTLPCLIRNILHNDCLKAKSQFLTLGVTTDKGHLNTPQSLQIILEMF